MRNILLSTIAFAAVGMFSATSAYAFDFGNSGVALDSRVELTYETKAEEFEATYEANLNYEFMTDLTVYVETEVDLAEPEFTGVDTGLSYEPAQFDGLEAWVEASFDEDFENDAVTIGVAYEF